MNHTAPECSLVHVNSQLQVICNINEIACKGVENGSCDYNNHNMFGKKMSISYYNPNIMAVYRMGGEHDNS